MFIAYDENGEKVSITHAEKGGSYYCPICHEKLIVKKKGEKKAAHFSHKPDSSCIDDWGDMSEWHLGWQDRFPEQYREVVLEKDGEKHRADICIEEKKLVIEFHISCDEFNRRNRFYTDCGYRLVWVLDAAGKIKDPNQYSIPPGAGGRVHCLNDYFEQELEWKRRQSTFERFRENNTGRIIAIYLEMQVDACTDKILVGVKDTDEKYIKVYTTSRYILKENFLKENGGFSDKSALSIGEIIQETKWVQKIEKARRDSQMKRNATVQRPSYRRRWRL